MLRRELRIEPAAATRQLYERIVNGAELATTSDGAARARPARNPSIAVLPFRCLTPATDLEYLAEALAEDVNTHLARLPGFLVISRSSTAAYRNETPTTERVAAELGVQYVVGGSLRGGPRGLKVSVQLSDSASAEHLWVDEFEFPAEDWSTIPDEITRGLVTRIEPALSHAEFGRLASRQPRDLDAWALYRRATGVLGSQGWHEQTFAEAADLLRRAATIAPDLAHVHAYLALVLALAHLTGLIGDAAEARQEAVAAAERALQLDARSSIVLGHVGCALGDLGDTARGLRLLDRAIEHDPSNAQAWSARGATLSLCGRPAEGADSLRHGMRLSPLDSRLAIWGGMLAAALMSAGDVEQAVIEAGKACRHDDRAFMPRLILAAALLELGKTAESRQAFRDAKRVGNGLTADNVRRILGPRLSTLMLRHGVLLDDATS